MLRRSARNLGTQTLSFFLPSRLFCYGSPYFQHSPLLYRHRNPGARIGEGLFTDHGTGIVIGETTIIGNNVSLYQGVTLGGTGKEKGKRHPTIEDGVVVASGAKVLGSFTVGEGSKIGAGSVVLREVPPYSTVVGIPGHIVSQRGKRIRRVLTEQDIDLDHTSLPDPLEEEIAELKQQVCFLQKRLNDLDSWNSNVRHNTAHHQ